MITPEKILDVLPPYQDQWLTITPDQDVKDIVKEIVEAHKEFAPYYDKFALWFDDKDVEVTANKLFDFCKKYIRYKEETTDDQTTTLPTGLLKRQRGDCKHYASFIAGVLSSIERQTGKKINGNYRFASYDPLNPQPHHVFIVLKKGRDEIAIDPTPGSETKEPIYFLDKNFSNMALRRNIAGLLDTQSYMQNTNTDANASLNNLLQQAGSLIPGGDTITSFISSLFGNITIGDQVPNYPIKSKHTLQFILSDISHKYPNDPTTLSEAKSMLAALKADAAAAYVKDGGGVVNTTYGMIYDEMAQKLQQAINSGAFGSSSLGLPGSAGSFVDWIKAHPVTIGVMGVGSVLAYKYMKKKRMIGATKKDPTILLIGGGLILILLMRKKNSAQSSQASLPANTTPANNLLPTNSTQLQTDILAQPQTSQPNISPIVYASSYDVADASLQPAITDTTTKSYLVHPTLNVY